MGVYAAVSHLNRPPLGAVGDCAYFDPRLGFRLHDADQIHLVSFPPVNMSPEEKLGSLLTLSGNKRSGARGSHRSYVQPGGGPA
jgi:hypothetical protein